MASFLCSRRGLLNSTLECFNWFEDVLNSGALLQNTYPLQEVLRACFGSNNILTILANHIHTPQVMETTPKYMEIFFSYFGFLISIYSLYKGILLLYRYVNSY